MKKYIAIVALAAIVSACNQAPESAPQTDATPKMEVFGDKNITTENIMPTATFVSQLATTEKLNTKIEGEVKSVCQKKGCWMKVEVADGKEVFVKFKDYDFFVPMDIAGRKVVIEGEASQSVTSVDELRHYAEDAGKSKEEIEAITEPENNLSFMATGVIVR